MNTRRNFLTALASLPFLGWLKPVESAPLVGVVEGYDPSTNVLTLAGGCCCGVDSSTVTVTIHPVSNLGYDICYLPTEYRFNEDGD